jgi:hypothetical protein
MLVNTKKGNTMIGKIAQVGAMMQGNCIKTPYE